MLEKAKRADVLGSLAVGAAAGFAVAGGFILYNTRTRGGVEGASPILMRARAWTCIACTPVCLDRPRSDTDSRHDDTTALLARGGGVGGAGKTADKSLAYPASLPTDEKEGAY